MVPTYGDDGGQIFGWAVVANLFLLRVLQETDPEHVLLDGTLAECDRVGDGRADFSEKPCRHGVNVQVVASPTGNPLWIPFTLPGRTHDLTSSGLRGVCLAEDLRQHGRG